MTDYSLRCRKESAREYVRYAVMGSGAFKRPLPMVMCVALITAMPILGIVGYIITGNIAMLFVVGCALLMGVGMAVFLNITVNSTAEKFIEAYNKQDGLVCSVSDTGLTVVRDNRPQRVIGWSEITEMDEGKNAFFLKENDELLIILDKSEVLSGSVQETSELIAQKRGEKK